MERTDSWLETFFNLTCMVQESYDQNWQLPVNTVVKTTQSLYGHYGLCELVKEWTNAFEKQFEGETWEEKDFYEELVEFFELKNKEQ